MILPNEKKLLLTDFFIYHNTWKYFCHSTNGSKLQPESYNGRDSELAYHPT